MTSDVELPVALEGKSMRRKYRPGETVRVIPVAMSAPSDVRARVGQIGTVKTHVGKRGPTMVTFEDGETVLFWSRELEPKKK